MKKTVVSMAAAAAISAGYAAAADASETHTVQAGDTLFSIANQYKISVVQLMQLNGLESDRIMIHDELIVSGSVPEDSQPEQAEEAAVPAEETLIQAASSSSVYTIKSGDSLSLIASRHGMSVAALKKLNGLSSDLIFAGQKLKVSGTAVSKPSAVKPAAPKPGSSTGTGVYTVQAGDSLSRIAVNYRMSVSALKQLNGLTSDTVYIGQKLKVSGSASVQKPSASKPQPSSPAPSSSSVYTVKSGDSLSRIAIAYKTSVSALKQLNGLTGDVIYAGQKLKVTGKASSGTVSRPSVSAPAPSSGGTYVVKSGDSLSLIASRHSMSVSALKQMNGLKSDIIFAGQKLKVAAGASSGAPSVSKPAKPSGSASAGGYSVSSLISVAQSVVGTPYVWGGSSPGGFDCSGFIYYAFNEAGKSIPRTNTDGYYSRSFEVSSPQLGDLVFFSNTYKPGISHMGIYIGGNQFIHAGSSGVSISSLDNSYYKSKFTAFKRFY